jgi:hypothetical protein
MTGENQLRGWSEGALYNFLMETFPAYRTTYCAIYEVFDVKRFSSEPEIAKTAQAIYFWLRSGKLTTVNARRIVALAGREDNAAVLAAAGRKTPEIGDLLPFL